MLMDSLCRQEDRMNPADPQPINCRRPDKIPVRLFWSGSSLTVDCCLKFNKRALRTGPSTDPGRSYAEWITEGIIRHWSGQRANRKQ